MVFAWQVVYTESVPPHGMDMRTDFVSFKRIKSCILIASSVCYSCFAGTPSSAAFISNDNTTPKSLMLAQNDYYYQMMLQAQQNAANMAAIGMKGVMDAAVGRGGYVTNYGRQPFCWYQQYPYSNYGRCDGGSLTGYGVIYTCCG